MDISTRITHSRGSANRSPITRSMPWHANADIHSPQAATGFQTPLDALQALEQWRILEEQTKPLAVRWPLEQFPLQVAFEAHPSLPNADECHQTLFQAMRQWEAASQGIIQFKYVEASPGSSQPPADIIIHWSEQTVLGRDFEVGHTHRTVQNQRIRQAHITLILNPIIDAHLSPLKQKQRLYATILHETGHALGLEHSENPQDVMHHRGWQRPYLGPGDIQRIQQLYHQKSGLLG